MAEVWLAQQRGPAGFAKQVVIKKILPDLAADLRFVEMFQNEARLAALLNHPNIVQIFDLGDDAGSYFIVMEFVHGCSLRRLMRRLAEVRRVMPPAIAVQIVANLCEGLHHAHELCDHRGRALGLVHRDVSPENALISFTGQVKLVDFGIAKATSIVSTQVTGPLHGKLTYLAPEQIRGEPADRRVDVYGLGMILYELLTGVSAFANYPEQGLWHAKINEDPRPIAQLRPEIPGPLTGIVARALARQREHRTPDARALRLELDTYLKDAPTPAIDIAALMAELFPDEVMPPAATPEDEDRPTSVTSLLPRGSTVASSSSLLKRRVLLAAMLAMGALGLGVAGVTMRDRRPEQLSRMAGPAAKASAPAPVAVDAEELGAEPSPPPLDFARPRENERMPPSQVNASKRKARARGLIDVRVNPWGEIRIDRELVGTTPVAPISTAAGMHVITATNDELGKNKTVRVRVVPSQTTTIRIDLLE
jgi:serine/threonine-protein kinase